MPIRHPIEPSGMLGYLIQGGTISPSASIDCLLVADAHGELVEA